MGRRVDTACFARASQEVEREGAAEVEPGNKHYKLPLAMQEWVAMKHEGNKHDNGNARISRNDNDMAGNQYDTGNGRMRAMLNPLEHREDLHLHLLDLPLRICVVYNFMIIIQIFMFSSRLTESPNQ